jgi:hypothetical protein
MMSRRPQLTFGRSIRRQLVGHEYVRSIHCFFSSLRISVRAAALSRSSWTRMSRISPSQATARHRYIRLPWIETTASSKCQVAVGSSPSRRKLREYAGLNAAPTAGLSRKKRQGPTQPTLLHMAVAQGETLIEPDSLPDDLGWELVSNIGDGLHSHPTGPRPGPSAVPVTARLFQPPGGDRLRVRSPRRRRPARPSDSDRHRKAGA